MPRTSRDDPHGGYHFELVLDGVGDGGSKARASFAEVSGLEKGTDPIEHRKGKKQATARKSPGLRKIPNIVLKRGVVDDLALWNWITRSQMGDVDRADGTIVLLDEKGHEVMSWNVTRAWPCKWTGPAPNAKGNEIVLETLEISHEGLEVV